MGSGREAHGKENPRTPYAACLRTEPACLVRGSSRRITIMRFRPANIRVIKGLRSRLLPFPGLSFRAPHLLRREGSQPSLHSPLVTVRHFFSKNLLFLLDFVFLTFYL